MGGLYLLWLRCLGNLENKKNKRNKEVNEHNDANNKGIRCEQRVERDQSLMYVIVHVPSINDVPYCL